MSEQTENLIASLAQMATPARQAASPLRLFAKWLAVAAVYAGIILSFGGLRPDLAFKLHTPLFAAEVAALALLVLTSGLAATALAFPDLHGKRWLLFTPLLPLLVFLLVLFVEWQGDTAPRPVHGIECLLCIAGYTALPALFMLYLLRKQASIHRGLAGAVALVASASLGCFAIRLSEQTDSMSHLLQWHYLPMLGFAGLGVLLGSKLLKW